MEGGRIITPITIDSMTLKKAPLLILAVAVVVSGVLVGVRGGEAQIHPSPEPIPELIAAIQESDSWDVQVAHACLVDSETVKAGTVDSKAERDFKTKSRTNEAGAAASDQGKAACEEAKDEARKALPGKLWEQGDKQCHQWDKAPEGKKGDEKKKPEQCRAVRGNLHGPDIKCSCDFKGQNPIQGLSDEWKVTATCGAPDVKYVCDP